MERPFRGVQVRYGVAFEIRNHLKRIKHWKLFYVKPINELTVPGYHFYYGEDVGLDPFSNTLIYYPKVIQREVKYNDIATDYDARLHTCVQSPPPPEIIFDNVAVIPLRSIWNLFHFMEGSNTIIHNLFYAIPRIPVSPSPLAHALGKVLLSFPRHRGGLLLRLVPRLSGRHSGQPPRGRATDDSGTRDADETPQESFISSCGGRCCVGLRHRLFIVWSSPFSCFGARRRRRGFVVISTSNSTNRKRRLPRGKSRICRDAARSVTSTTRTKS